MSHIIIANYSKLKSSDTLFELSDVAPFADRVYRVVICFAPCSLNS